MFNITQIRVANERKMKSVNPYVPLSETEVLEKLETARTHASEGNVRDADDVIADMRGIIWREKY